MRIGMLVDMYLPHVSGITNHISLYKRRFEQLGHEVFVLTFGDLDYDDAEPAYTPAVFSLRARGRKGTPVSRKTIRLRFKASAVRCA